MREKDLKGEWFIDLTEVNMREQEDAEAKVGAYATIAGLRRSAGLNWVAKAYENSANFFAKKAEEKSAA